MEELSLEQLVAMEKQQERLCKRLAKRNRLPGYVWACQFRAELKKRIEDKMRARDLDLFQYACEILSNPTLN